VKEKNFINNRQANNNDYINTSSKCWANTHVWGKILPKFDEVRKTFWQDFTPFLNDLDTLNAIKTPLFVALKQFF